jgi:hypothetical protein
MILVGPQKTKMLIRIQKVNVRLMKFQVRTRILLESGPEAILVIF